MVRKLADLPACACKVDLGAFRALLWTTFHVESQTMASAEFAPNGRLVAAKASEKWAAAQATLVAAATGKGPLKLAIADGK